MGNVYMGLTIALSSCMIALLHWIRAQICYYTLRYVLGWKFKRPRTAYGAYSCGKHVVIYPHTSFLDPLVGSLFGYSCNIPIKAVAKKELETVPLLGRFVKMMGTIFIDRRSNTNTTKYITDELNKEKHFMFCIAPEGTRKKTECLRSGYFHIAQKTDSSIVLFDINFEKQVFDLVDISNSVIVQTTTYDKMKQKVEEAFKSQIPYHPEQCTFTDASRNPGIKTSFINLKSSCLLYVPPMIVGYIVFQVLRSYLFL